MILINLIYFILGILFVESLPLIESVIAYFMTILESAKVKASVSIASANKQINDIAESQQETFSHAIGFQVPSEEVEEYYKEEEE